VDVEVEGKSQRFFAWKRMSLTQDPVTLVVTLHGPDHVGATGYFWTGSTSRIARGRPTAQFSWGGSTDSGISGQFVVRGEMYTIGTLGRFHVLLASRQPLSAIPGTEPQYFCVDSTGTVEFDTKPLARCDRPQRLHDEFGDAGPTIAATLTEAEAEPFKRLHRKLRVSPLRCGTDEITYCDGMVRIGCNAAADAPVNYYDNASAELLGTCAFWIRDRACMPQRWKTCAVKNGIGRIGAEPDPLR
jgi:hypothetical protein